MRAVTLLFLALAPLLRAAPLTTEAYIWQQKGSPALDAAIERAAPLLAGFAPQAADYDFTRNQSRLQTAEVPWAVLARAGRPVSPVIRIPFAYGGLGSSPEHLSALVDLIHTLRDTARAAGLASFAEIQIDYDCAESRLPGYAAFLSQLRAALPDVPLAFTALPAWLDQPAFRDLAAATGRYVLQVHSLVLPPRGAAQAVIFDPAAARLAITAASRLGTPFRIALPTYGCVAVTAPSGRSVGVFSETSPVGPLDTPGLQAVRGDSDPAVLARFVTELNAQPPAACTGLLWFRLPVEGDQRNWPWPAFRAVLEGRTPTSSLALRAVPAGDGVAKIQILNTGETRLPLPAALTITWPTGSLHAADALGPYTPAPQEKLTAYRLRLPDQLATRFLPDLAPGQSIFAGWLRTDDPAALRITAE